jgi:hypothetical protein
MRRRKSNEVVANAENDDAGPRGPMPLHHGIDRLRSPERQPVLERFGESSLLKGHRRTTETARGKQQKKDSPPQELPLPEEDRSQLMRFSVHAKECSPAPRKAMRQAP